MRVTDELTRDLALRANADQFFDRIEQSSANCVTLDFTGVHSISRSFAHQYALRKQRTDKVIRETHLESDVEKMIRLVEHQTHSSSFLRLPPMKHPRTITV
jgi:hypothetical protein